MCPHTTMYVSLYYYVCVFILPHTCPHASHSHRTLALAYAALSKLVPALVPNLLHIGESLSARSLAMDTLHSVNQYLHQYLIYYTYRRVTLSALPGYGHAALNKLVPELVPNLLHIQVSHSQRALWLWTRCTASTLSFFRAGLCSKLGTNAVNQVLMYCVDSENLSRRWCLNRALLEPYQCLNIALIAP